MSLSAFFHLEEENSGLLMQVGGQFKLLITVRKNMDSREEISAQRAAQTGREHQTKVDLTPSAPVNIH